MKSRILAAVCLVSVAIVFGLVSSNKRVPKAALPSPKINAIPAGVQHIQSSGGHPPDATSEDPAVDNFISVHSKWRGCCQALSQFEDIHARGGFPQSSNAAQRVQSTDTASGLTLVAQPCVATKLVGASGMRVSLINNTQDILAFNAIDSTLNLVQEAQDVHGNWQAIEDLSTASCGNSYHRVFLAPQHFWTFATPRYKGTVATKLRFAMTLTDGSRLLSNTFDGSVNPEQMSLAASAQ